MRIDGLHDVFDQQVRIEASVGPEQFCGTGVQPLSDLTAQKRSESPLQIPLLAEQQIQPLRILRIGRRSGGRHAGQRGTGQLLRKLAEKRRRAG